MKNVYIFDLDGTLMDSMGYYGEGMVSILKEDRIDYPEDVINKVTPMGMYKSAFKELLGAYLTDILEKFL